MVKLDVLKGAIRRIEAGAVQGQRLDSDGVLARAVSECADELLKLDGYERKARSRRKKAFRALYE